MNNDDPNFSRINRKRRSTKSNQVLNLLIGLVVLMIIVVGAFIIIDPQKNKDSELASEQSSSDPIDSEQGEAQDESGDEDDDAEEPENEEVESANNQNTDTSSTNDGSDENGADSATSSDDDEEENPGTVTIVPNEDEVIEESVVNTAWKPVGTEQTGVHESKYYGESVDWFEKQKAIAYATGFTEDELIYWKIKNGGSPQKSIGIVSTKDKSKKFRVFLEWVDEQGWQPVKMDKLTTLDFEY